MSLDEDVTARILDITGGKGHWGAADCVCGDVIPKLCAATRPWGNVLLYGAMASPATTVTVAETLFRCVGVKGYWVQIDLQSLAPEQRAKRMEEVYDLFRCGATGGGQVGRVWGGRGDPERARCCPRLCVLAGAA